MSSSFILVKEVIEMMDSILIDAVKKSADEARDFAEHNMSLNEGGIAAEIVSFDQNGECNYTLMIERPFGEARKHRSYRDFLTGQVKDAHGFFLNGKEPIKSGWGASNIVYEYCNLSYDNNSDTFSVLIGAVGGTERQNRRLAELISSAIVK